MKNQITLMLLIFIGLISCSDETQQIDDNQEKNITIKSIFHSPIAKDDEKTGVFKVVASDASIKQSIQNFLARNNKKVKATSYELIDIDANKYLRIFRNDNQVTTVAVSLNKKTGFYQTEGTSCTSSRCSNGGDCLPDGPYCTKCIPSDGVSYYGNCERTTVSSQHDK